MISWEQNQRKATLSEGFCLQNATDIMDVYKEFRRLSVVALFPFISYLASVFSPCRLLSFLLFISHDVSSRSVSLSSSRPAVPFSFWDLTFFLFVCLCFSKYLLHNLTNSAMQQTNKCHEQTKCRRRKYASIKQYIMRIALDYIKIRFSVL